MESKLPEETRERLFDLLERLRKLRHGRPGEPALTRLDSSIGRSRGYLRRQLKGEIRMSATDLFRVFELLGADPEEYISAARHGLIPAEIWLGELAREGQGEVRAWRKIGPELAPLDLNQALCRLDELLRLGSPKVIDMTPYFSAVSKLKKPADHEEKLLCLRTWMHLGTSYRQRGALPLSAYCYRQALFLCEDSPLYKAHILRRVCFLASDALDTNSSLHFANQAIAIYMHHLQSAYVGRALIDSALALARAEPHRAARSLAAGLRFLEDDTFYQLSACQALGHYHTLVGNLNEAHDYLREAKDIYTRMRKGPRQQASFDWLSADIALREHDFNTALFLFDKVRHNHLISSRPDRLALMNLRMAKIYTQTNDRHRLAELNAETINLTMSLRSVPIQRLITEFHRRFIDRTLTVQSLDHIYFRIIQLGSSL